MLRNLVAEQRKKKGLTGKTKLNRDRTSSHHGTKASICRRDRLKDEEREARLLQMRAEELPNHLNKERPSYGK